MDRTRRCEELARLSDSELASLGGMIPAALLADRVVLAEPMVGMVMARVIEGAHGEVFNAGEVLVTECQVRIGRHEGWGMVMGSRPSAALAIATIDAAIASGQLDPTPLDGRLAGIIAAHDAVVAASQAELAATRVQFETQ